MNSLLELCNFVGLGAATPASPDGKPSTPKPSTLTAARNLLAPVLTGGETLSLRAIIGALSRLSPVSLDAECIGPSVGEETLRPTVRVYSSGGLILSTVLNFFKGATIAYPEEPFSESAQTTKDFSALLFGVGIYVIKVTRIGIPNTGIAVLEKSIPITVNSKPAPSPPSPPTPATVKPSITVSYKGPFSSPDFTVTGKDFLANHAVHVRVVNVLTLAEAFFNSTSDASKSFTLHITFPIAAAGMSFAFSANDERPDSSDLTGTLWSNTVQLVAT